MTDEEAWLLEEKSFYMKVVALCEDHAVDAKNISRAKVDGDRKALAKMKDKYEKGRNEAAAIAIKLQDEFYRHASLYYVLVLCMKASDFEVAALIGRAITTSTIQDKILQEFPEYFVLSDRDGMLHPTVVASTGGILR